MRRLSLPSFALLLCISLPCVAKAQSGGGHTPYASAASETNALIKSTRGVTLYVRGNNVTANAGYMVLINAASVPADTSTLTPLACAKIAANGDAELFVPAPIAHNTGIVVLFTAATTCFTRTNTNAPSGLFTVLYE